MKTRSSSPVRQLDRADDPVAVLERDHLEGVSVGRVVGRDPLDHAVRRCRARAPGSRRRPRRWPASTGPARARRAPGRRTPRAGLRRPGEGAAAVAGSAGRSMTPSRSTRPSEVTAPYLAAGGGRDGRDDHVVRRARPRRRQRLGRRGCGPAARWRTAGRGTGRRPPPAARAATADAVPADSSSTVRRGVPCALATSASSSDTSLRSRVSESRSAVSASMVALQLVALGLQLDPAEPGQPAQRHVEDVLRLDLGQLEDRDQPLAGRPRCRRSCGSAG